MDHTISHIEIPSPDIQKAIVFYTKVFGWKVEMMSGNTYAVYRIGETWVSGGFDASTKPAGENVGPGIVINVGDIPAKLEDIKNAGGKVVMEKTEIPGGHGFYARFQDTNGNYMQVYSKT